MAYSLPEAFPPLESLAAAITAARDGSFSAAASALGVTHAAISRRVAAAEQWAGIRLFERHGRGVRPTVEGERLLIRVSQTIDALDRVAVRRPKISLPTVRVSTTPSFARYWLLPRIRAMEEAIEKVRIEIDTSPRPVDLQVTGIDIAIRYGRGGWRIGRETKLFDERLVPFASPRLFDRSKQAQVNEILALPHLHNGDALGWRTWAEAMGRVHRPKAVDRFMLDYSLTTDAARAALGVVLLNRSIHRPTELPTGLIALHSEEVKGPYGYYVISSANASAMAKKVVAQVIKNAVRD